MKIIRTTNREYLCVNVFGGTDDDFTVVLVVADYAATDEKTCFVCDNTGLTVSHNDYAVEKLITALDECVEFLGLD